MFKRGVLAARWLTRTWVPLSPTWAPSRQRWQKVLAREGSYSRVLLLCTAAPPHTPPPRTHPAMGSQLNRAFEKVLLWWPEQEKGSGAPAASVSAKKPSKHEIKARKHKERQEKLAPSERRPLHPSHLCKSPQQSRRQTNPLTGHRFFSTSHLICMQEGILS